MCSKYALLKKNKTTVGCQTGAIVFVTKRTKNSFFLNLYMKTRSKKSRK